MTGQYIFCPNNSNTMKSHTKGSCVAIVSCPALSPELRLSMSKDRVLQMADEFSSGRFHPPQQIRCLLLDATVPHMKKGSTMTG